MKNIQQVLMVNYFATKVIALITKNYLKPYQKKNKVMKTNEAPERIYIRKESFETPWPPAIDENSNYVCIEYIRTDAFIEKAEKFLEDNLIEEDCKFGWGEWTKVKSGDNPIASFMRAFRNYIEG